MKCKLSVVLPVLLISMILPVFGAQAAPSADPVPPAEGGGGPKLLPAVATAAAGKSAMLDSCRAGKRIVAVGDHGIVLLSDDDGKKFRQARSVPVRSTLTGVTFADDKNGWAVGHWGVIIATTDGGETWQLQRSDTAVDQPLFSVYFKDRSNGWAVGLWSLMLVTADGGKTWDKVRLPPPPGGGKGDRNLLRIFASPSGTLLVAAEQGTIFRSAGNGWNIISTGNKGSFWTGLALKNGHLLVGGLRGKVYRSADDGKSWKEIGSGTMSSVTAFAEAADRVYAVGLDGIVLESSNGGVTFSARQRDDRTPFTTLTVTESGAPVAFSKGGMVMDFPTEKKK